MNEYYFGFFVLFGFQESIEPLPVEDVNKVWEHMRDYGILVGKGGIFGNVNGSFWSFDVAINSDYVPLKHTYSLLSSCTGSSN